VDGWLHTGDVGYLDASGLLFVVDRVKEMIVSGGFKVYPREVERVIETFPEVAQVAVIGVPSARWGEEVKALIQLAPGAVLSGREVIDRCAGELGRYKLPKSVEFVESFPLNPNGKILKRMLRDAYRTAGPGGDGPGGAAGGAAVGGAVPARSYDDPPPGEPAARSA
jgi:acyl-CoA synthetase (AMP-forming)/AMP-acid ligase II